MIRPGNLTYKSQASRRREKTNGGDASIKQIMEEDFLRARKI